MPVTTTTDLTPAQIAQVQAMWALMGNVAPMNAGQIKTLQIQTLLADQGISEGARVFLRYTAAHEPTQRQIELSAPAAQLGIPRQEYTGTYDGLHFNKQTGEAYIRLRGLPERLVGEGAENNFRNFNLVQGTVHEIKLLTAARV